MKREEALKFWKFRYWEAQERREHREYVEALRMAIDALQFAEHFDLLKEYQSLQEVVRCKDCKHWYADADTGMACEFTNMGQPEDGYCNWGERKGGDSE